MKKALEELEKVVRGEGEEEAYGALPTPKSVEYLASFIIEMAPIEPSVYGRYDGGIELEWESACEAMSLIVEDGCRLNLTIYEPGDNQVRESYVGMREALSRVEEFAKRNEE